MTDRPSDQAIASKLKSTYKRPELNQLAKNHYGIDDPVGFRTQDDLIAAMIAANHDRASQDAGFDVPDDDVQVDTASLNAALTDALNDLTPHVYTAEELEALDTEALHALASDEFGIDAETHDDRASLIGAMLAGQDESDDDEPEPDPELPEGRVLIIGSGPHNRAAYWERHPDHPDGEVFVRGGQRAEAGLTAGVQRAAAVGRIAIVDGK